jgi:hypothetical protein
VNGRVATESSVRSLRWESSLLDKSSGCAQHVLKSAMHEIFTKNYNEDIFVQITIQTELLSFGDIICHSSY